MRRSERAQHRAHRLAQTAVCRREHGGTTLAVTTIAILFLAAVWLWVIVFCWALYRSRTRSAARPRYTRERPRVAAVDATAVDHAADAVDLRRRRAA